MKLIGQFRALGDLLGVRPPLFEADELEALLKQVVHIDRNCTMIFHHARRYPISNAPTLKKIIIDWPDLGAVTIGSPARITVLCCILSLIRC